MNYISKIENIIFEKVFKYKLNRLIKRDLIPNNYKYFKDVLEIKNWSNSYNKYFENLRMQKDNCQATKTQLKELELYDFYAGYMSEKMNDYLRGKPVLLITKEYLIEDIKILEKNISKFSLRENIIVLRRMPSKFLKKDYKKGNIFIEKGFLSTTLNLNQRLDYQSNKRLLKNESLLIIKILKGINGVYTEEVQPKERRRKEYEFIVQKERKIIVEFNKKLFSNRIIILKIIE